MCPSTSKSTKGLCALSCFFFSKCLFSSRIRIYTSSSVFMLYAHFAAVYTRCTAYVCWRMRWYPSGVSTTTMSPKWSASCRILWTDFGCWHVNEFFLHFGHIGQYTTLPSMHNSMVNALGARWTTHDTIVCLSFMHNFIDRKERSEQVKGPIGTTYGAAFQSIEIWRMHEFIVSKYFMNQNSIHFLKFDNLLRYVLLASTRTPDNYLMHFSIGLRCSIFNIHAICSNLSCAVSEMGLAMKNLATMPLPAVVFRSWNQLSLTTIRRGKLVLVDNIPMPNREQLVPT